MLHKEGRRWGTSTQQVIEAIQNNCTTLRSIADCTGIIYRSVNAIVTSLEMQGRVLARDYSLKRGNQQFKVIHAGKQPRKRAPSQRTSSERHQVMKAIESNCATLRAIADYTGILYRSVNGIVTLLETQERVQAEDYSLKRGDQQFKVIRADKPYRKRAPSYRAASYRVQGMALTPIADVQSLLGMGMFPANAPTINGNVLVHRLV